MREKICGNEILQLSVQSVLQSRRIDIFLYNTSLSDPFSDEKNRFDFASDVAMLSSMPRVQLYAALVSWPSTQHGSQIHMQPTITINTWWLPFYTGFTS